MIPNRSNRSLFPRPTLSSILDEQFVITHTATAATTSFTPLLSESKSLRRGKSRVILDQIDGICTWKECENYVTTRTYPRGVYFRQRGTKEAGTTGIDLVVAAEAFEHWKEVEEVESNPSSPHGKESGQHHDFGRRGTRSLQPVKTGINPVDIE